LLGGMERWSKPKKCQQQAGKQALGAHGQNGFLQTKKVGDEGRQPSREF